MMHIVLSIIFYTKFINNKRKIWLINVHVSKNQVCKGYQNICVGQGDFTIIFWKEYLLVLNHAYLFLFAYKYSRLLFSLEDYILWWIGMVWDKWGCTYTQNGPWASQDAYFWCQCIGLCSLLQARLSQYSIECWLW